MKSLLLTIALLLTLQPLFAQNPIPNPGFEDWTDQGDYEEPDNWYTINPVLTMFGGNASVTKTTDARTGTYALSARTDTMLMGMPMSGMAVTSFALQTPPVALKGYYKFIATSSDPAVLMMVVSHWNSQTQQRDTLGYGFKFALAASDYTSFELPVDYTSTQTPDSVHIVFLSGMDGTGIGSELMIDDLSLELPMVSAPELQQSLSLQVYPNPCHSQATLVLPEQFAQNFELTITDALGRTHYSRSCSATNVANGKLNLNVSGFPQGMYVVNIVSAGQQTNTRLIITR